MIIIEGPDCVGKTTVCKKLLKILNGESLGLPHVYAHFTKLPAGFDYYHNYLDRASRYVVQDRFHLSEIVYSRARGIAKSPLCPERYRLVDAALRNLGTITVLITADDGLIRERWDQSQMYNTEITLAAADGFRRLGELFPEYDPDIDFNFHCTKGIPYVPDTILNEILTKYLCRQELSGRTSARRYGHRA